MGDQSAHRKPRLLLAEDEPSLWLFLNEVLPAEYAVEATWDGEQAWQAAQRERPDLVLSDVCMPGLNGIDLAHRLRTDPRTANVPILLLSANSKKELCLRGMDPGANDLLLKPFKVGELLEKLRAMWSSFKDPG